MAAYKTIQKDMRASGFDIPMRRLRQQWGRIKVGAIKPASHRRKTTLAKGNNVPFPPLHEFNMLEDTVFTGSNTIESKPINLSCNMISLCTSSFEASLYHYDDTVSCKNTSSDYEVSGPSGVILRKLLEQPKNRTTEVDVFYASQEQFLKEELHSEELHGSSGCEPFAPSGGILRKLLELPKNRNTKVDIFYASQEQFLKKELYLVKLHASNNYEASGSSGIILDKLLEQPKNGTTEVDVFYVSREQFLKEELHSEKFHVLQMEQLRSEVQKRRKDQLEEIRDLQCQLHRLQEKKQDQLYSINKHCETCYSSESTTSASTKLALLKCVWCSQMLSINDRPKLLECLHVSCSQCVNTKFSELDRTMPPLIHCPICNMASQNEFIIDNQFLIEQCTASGENNMSATEGNSSDNTKMSAAPNIQCSSCPENAVATSWCVDCSEYICDSCVQAHQRWKITKDHTIKPKEEANSEQLPGAAGIDKLHMCHVHPQEKLSLFCETCDKLTCRDCQLSDHRDHKYKFAHEIATETRQALKTLVSEINYKRFLLSSATKVIDDRQQQIADRKKDLIKEITAMVVKITNTVNMRGKQLVMRLNEVCDSKMKVLIEKKDALQLLSDNTDHCIEFMENALEKGSDYAILSSKKSLVRHLQKLKCQRADIPNPEIPVRIQVQLNQVSELQKVISQLGTVIVDGKPYPPTPTPNGPPRQQPSPNMAPPLRPGLPPGMPAGMSPTGPPSGFGPQNGPPMYNNSSSQQQFNNMQMNRNYAADGAVRFAGMPPVGMQRQGQPHVSSSTHPQNMDMSLRGLLNNQAAQSPNQAHMSFNGPPNYPGGPQGAPSPHQQISAQMRPHFMAGPPGQQHQSFSQATPGGPNNPNFMNNSNRFQSYQRMSSHAQQQAAVAAMSSGAGPGGPCGSQIPSPNAMQRPQMISNPMQNNLGFHGSQASFSPAPPQTSPQMSSGMSGMHSMAKWHIPQSAQQTNSCPQQGPMMQFANGRQTENFKISLKSPNTLKNTTPPNGNSTAHSIQNSGNSNLHAASLGLGPAVSILPNVTSTNPKTPSPSTNENAKDFTEPIDKVRDDSINDLMATIAKLDSNGVQVLPEGRTKTTSPQVHSSTDLSNTQEVNNKNDQKDDPNEDWCAVCLDGGELMCCDKCPKVFHQNCHIPAISSLPDESESWQCLLCVNLKELASNTENTQKVPGELSRLELQIMQRICLELYCQYEQSLHFREPEPPSNTAYYEIICSPMSLDVIRTRLDPSSPNHYKEIAGFIADVRLIFKNTYLFYQEDSKTYSNAKYLESFFEEQLAKWLPNFANKNHIANNNTNIVNNANASTSSASPGLININSGAVGSPLNGISLEAAIHERRSCSAALGVDDESCIPSKRPRKLTE